jgi:PAS domain S-box-containing protein
VSSEAFGRAGVAEALEPVVSMPSAFSMGAGDVNCNVELSPTLRDRLLDLDAWDDILATYGRTMKVAVALTDIRGHLLGNCQNAQPVWKMFQDVVSNWGDRCPFCITTHLSCTAVEEALQAGGVVMVRDQAGLTHVAVPLLLGKQYLGAIIAGQVFDQYPEPLPLRRVAKEFGVSAQHLWDVSRKQRPVSSAALKASGDLLFALGRAFLQQRYGTILEAKLAETNGRFRSLVEGATDYALFTIDHAGRVTSWNKGAERMLGYTESDIVGQNFSCTFVAKDIEDGMPARQLQRALKTGRAEDEGLRLRANREQFWANINITTLLADSGASSGFSIMMHDGTDRRRVAVALEESRQERVRLQDRFLSHVSHELRTPLTAIYVYTTNVLDGLLGELTPEQHEHLAFALENVQQLKGMVSDLLDVTRVATHKLIVEPRHASPTKLIAEVLGACRTNAAMKNINLRSEIAKDLPFIWADPVRVRQILTNLVDNGIKFTPDGGSVTVANRPFSANDDFLCLSVSDTGCGISPESQEVIFNRLAQVKSTVEASRSGLGLGLFIARELVLRHSGRIWVESQLCQGSTFYFTLRLFSLAKLCAHIFTVPNLEAGSVALVAVDVVAVENTIQAEVVPEIRKILKRCIHATQDLLLPSMSDAEPENTFFIIACTDPSGFAVIAKRIGRELKNFDIASKLKPVISSTTLLLAPGQSSEEQIADVVARIERLVGTHLREKEKRK